MDLLSEDLTTENCIKVLDMARKYDIRMLKKKCSMELLSEDLTTENCIKVSDMACKYELWPVAAFVCFLVYDLWVCYSR